MKGRMTDFEVMAIATALFGGIFTATLFISSLFYAADIAGLDPEVGGVVFVGVMIGGLFACMISTGIYTLMLIIKSLKDALPKPTTTATTSEEPAVD